MSGGPPLAHPQAMYKPTTLINCAINDKTRQRTTPTPSLCRSQLRKESQEVKERKECEDMECLRRRRMRKGEKAEILRGLSSVLEIC